MYTAHVTPAQGSLLDIEQAGSPRSKRKRGRGRAGIAWKLGVAALCVGCVWPFFHGRYLPIQDLPQHLAAVRVLHDFDNPLYGFKHVFELRLTQTQYLSYYLAADLLAFLVDVELANRLLLAIVLLGIAAATRSVLCSLGKDGRLALLVLPLSYSAHLVLGFLNFIAAIPLSLYGVALAIRLRRNYSHARAAGLALVSLVCFYTHVVPFALLALGVGSIALARDVRVVARGVWPLLPAGAAALAWLRTSPAGRATAGAAGATAGIKPTFQSPELALQELPRWLTDVFESGAGLWLLWGWVALIVFAAALAGFERVRPATRGAGAVPDPGEAAAADHLTRALSLRLWAIPVLCAGCYFVLPVSYAWIWPISPRFPLLCALWIVPVLPRFSLGRAFVLGAAVALSAVSFYLAGRAFQRFDRDEVGDFDAALEKLPPRQRVVGMIFDRGSAEVSGAPFMHYVAYYQVRKGGTVMFTFADFPQSPFRFKPGHRPPRVPPSWEWSPQRLRPSEFGYYDYALVRGGPGPIEEAGSGFAPIYRGDRWSVWERTGVP